MMLNAKMLAAIRKSTPERIANELNSVQPMPTDVLESILENTMSESDLINEGYQPVSHIGLIWRKK